MKITIKYTGGIINLPSNIADIVPSAGEAELKVIISIFAYSGHFNDFESVLPILSEKLELEINEVISALEFWAENGIITLDGYEISPSVVSAASERSNCAPTYTGSQITKLLGTNPDFKMLADCAQNVLGKDFTPTDFTSLLFIKDHYKFSDEYILMLLAYCVENNTTNWAYIRKTSKILYDEGIDTYEKLESHFSARRNKRSFEYKIRKLFGVGGREFTSKEKNTFEKWVDAKFSYDLIKRAYELCIDNTGKSSWSYTSKILENWQIAGIKTVEDAEKSLASYKNKQNMSSFDTDDFFEAALKRSQERIKERSKK
ncbi:MAG: DnaD domain protein [Clostridia bacterium]|nr:DnaD domain protein [Clostridia bacterium]